MNSIRLLKEHIIDAAVAAEVFADLQGAHRGAGEGRLVVGVVLPPVTPSAAELATAEGGLPTEALVADVLVLRYADNLPLYRQAQILAREGVAIDRSTLAHWVGFAAFELQPLHACLVEILKSSTKLFADETRCPALDPRRGKTKTRYLWALARDDRP